MGGSTADTAVVDGFATGDQVRSFRLMVPPGYDGSRPLPVIFAWHWLNASSASFVREAELESAVEELDFIAVLPDALRNANGDKAYFLSWPFAEVWGVEGELRFFDDLLACVNDQLNVDRDRVYGIGVSAGGLWLTSLAMTDRPSTSRASRSSAAASATCSACGAWSTPRSPTSTRRWWSGAAPPTGSP